MIYLAIDRIIHQDYDIDANTMIIVSSIGVIMNIAMGRFGVFFFFQQNKWINGY